MTGKRIALLGFASKADTNNTREAPAIRIGRDLLEEGAQLAIYDPKVSTQQIQSDVGCAPAPSDQRAADLSGDGSRLACGSVAEAVQWAVAAVILTEWREFRNLPWQELAALMLQPAWLFDARSVGDAAAARAAGLRVWVVGGCEG